MWQGNDSGTARVPKHNMPSHITVGWYITIRIFQRQLIVGNEWLKPSSPPLAAPDQQWGLRNKARKPAFAKLEQEFICGITLTRIRKREREKQQVRLSLVHETLPCEERTECSLPRHGLGPSWQLQQQRKLQVGTTHVEKEASRWNSVDRVLER